MLVIVLTIAFSASLRGSISPAAAQSARAYQTQEDPACPGPSCGMREGFQAFKELSEELAIVSKDPATQIALLRPTLP